MADGQYDYRTDPAFLKADPRMMTEYLDKIDPEFRNAAVEDKVAYVTHLRSLGGGGVPGGKYADTPTQFETERTDPGAASSTWNRLAGWAKGAFTTPQGWAGLTQLPTPEGVLSRYHSITDIPAATEARARAGRSSAYQDVAAIGTLTGLSDPTEMERNAELGKTGDIWSQFIGEEAPYIGGEAVGRLGIPLRNRVSRGFYQPGVAEPTLKPSLDKSLRYAGTGVGSAVGGYLGREMGGGHGLGAYEGAGMGIAAGAGLGGAFAPWAFKKLFPRPPMSGPYVTTPPPPRPTPWSPAMESPGGAFEPSARDFYNRANPEPGTLLTDPSGPPERGPHGGIGPGATFPTTVEAEPHIAKARIQRGKDLMVRQAEQDRLDQAHAQRMSDIEDARQQEITDWAKLDKVGEADRAAFQDRMGEIEKARQRELADYERLRQQHAQSLVGRETESRRLGDIALDQDRMAMEHSFGERSPFDPAGPGDIATSPFDPTRSGGGGGTKAGGGDFPPRPLTPLVGTEEEFGPLGKTGTHAQRMFNMKQMATDLGTYSAAYGKIGKARTYGERAGAAISKPAPAPPTTPPAPTVPASTPPLRFTKGGIPIEAEGEGYAGRERRTTEGAPTRKLYDLQKEMLQTDAERAAKGLGSISSIKAGAGMADRIADVLYPGKKYTDFPLGSPERKAIEAVFEKIKPQRK